LLSHFTPGGQFILDLPPEPVPTWGNGGDVLWAEGESLILVGGQGTGKTTLAQQLTLGRCGFPEYATLLGYPVRADERVLYLAMDRPQQIARSFRRMVGEAWRDELNDRLMVWPGPPLSDMAKDTGLLTQMAEAVAATTVVVDSIKDAAIGLSDDDVGGGWNRARQKCLRAGIQVAELHHQRKAAQGSHGHRLTLDDVYGSTWITSGAGSVILLTGAPGDAIVQLHHLKQPANKVGPLQVVHTHEDGQTTVWHAADLVQMTQAKPEGITAVEAAQALFDTDRPSPNQREKARRRLNALTEGGPLVVIVQGDRATSQPTRWGVL
jgi:replicative DNA helicase